MPTSETEMCRGFSVRPGDEVSPPECPLHRDHQRGQKGEIRQRTETMPARKKRFKQTKDHDQDVKLDTWPQFTYAFVNETTKLYGKHGPGTSTPHLMSSDRSSPSNTSVTDEITDSTETPASSVCTDVFEKLDSRLHDE